MIEPEVDNQQQHPAATIDPAASIEGTAERGYRILRAYPEPQLESKWFDCLAHSTNPAHYASPAFFKELYFRDKRPFAVLATVGDEVVGALTGLHSGEMVVSGLESRVHIAVDARYDADETIAGLAAGVEQEARGSKLVQVYSWRYRDLGPFVARGYRKREFTGNPVVDLSLGSDTLFSRLTKTHRKNVALATKNGVEVVEVATREDFCAFYDVYDQWCTAKQQFKYSNELEWEVFETTRSNRRLFAAKKDGKVIAGTTIRFYPGGLVEYSRNSSLPEFLRFCPNDLLLWHAIRWSSENSFSGFSMASHHKFVRGFGGTIIPIDRYRADRTVFRRHDLKDMAIDASRAVLFSLPPAYQQKVRKLLGRETQAGW